MKDIYVDLEYLENKIEPLMIEITRVLNSTNSSIDSIVEKIMLKSAI